MATDLWTRWKTALRFGWEDGPAALIAVARGAFAPQFGELLAATDTANGAPASASDGLGVEGLATVDLVFVFSAAAQSATFRLWVYDGTTWCAAESTKSVTAPTGAAAVFIDPFDLETFARVYAELVTPPASGTVLVKASPFNEVSP